MTEEGWYQNSWLLSVVTDGVLGRSGSSASFQRVRGEGKRGDGGKCGGLLVIIAPAVGLNACSGRDVNCNRS